MSETKRHHECPNCKSNLIRETNRFLKCSVCMVRIPFKDMEMEHGSSDGKSFIKVGHTREL